MTKNFKYLILILSLTSQVCFSQNLNLSGIISGYNYNPSKHIFKKNSDISLDGRLENVSIKVFENNKQILNRLTNKNGEFNLKIPVGKIYKIETSKTGYQSIIFNIDITKAKTNIILPSLELILNSYVPKRKKETTSIGTIIYENEKFNFIKAKSKDKNNAPLISLIEKSIKKTQSITEKNTESIIKDSVLTTNNSDEIINSSPVYSELLNKLNISNQQTIKEKEQTILEAKKQLEIDKQNAKTKLDSLLINERELLIEAAENELSQLKETIKEKEKVISLKNKQLVLIILLLILLAGLAFFVIRSNKIKTKLNKQLSLKNKKIADSISYAKKIQKAILSPKNDIQKIIPKSFIIYKPKDEVSGDFYWFDELDGKIIVAAVDCTGHGVPGAFMSMIGKVLMNDIIKEKKIFSPKKILSLLHENLKKALNQNDNDPFNSMDGMDLSICVIDKNKNTLTYAGAVNPLYLVKNNEVEILKVNNRGIGGFDIFNDGEFLEYTINIENGTNLYLLSDGLQDQFGGEQNEKFNTKRFEKLLIECRNKPIKEQELLIENTLKNWQSDNEQTDDILIIGINF